MNTTVNTTVAALVLIMGIGIIIGIGLAGEWAAHFSGGWQIPLR